MTGILIQVYHLLVGAVFVLSAYVIVRNLKRWRFNKEKLLPLHVWMISLSYVIIVGTFLHPNTNYDPVVVVLRFLSLFMGIYALWVLVILQRRKPN